MSGTTGPIRLAVSIRKDRADMGAFFNRPDETHRVLLSFVKEGLELRQKELHTNRGRVLWGPHWRQSRCSP